MTPSATIRTDYSASNRAGGAIADLLTLLAYGSNTPVALLAVPDNGGGWSTLSHGLTSTLGLEHDQLFDAASSAAGTMEFADILTSCPLSALAGAPNHLRWGYTTALRDEGGDILGVLAVLDLWLREVSKKNVRVLAVAARQIGMQLAVIRRLPGDVPHPPSRGLHSQDASALAVHGNKVHGSSSRSPAIPKLLRTSDVATIFQVTERTVTNWVAAGQLPSMRTVGGRLRFQHSDIMALIEINGTASTTALN